MSLRISSVSLLRPGRGIGCTPRPTRSSPSTKAFARTRNVTPALLVAQSLDGVEARGLPGGPEAEDYADGRRDAYADEYRPERDEGGERRVAVRQEARDLADYQARQSPQRREHDGLDKELPENVRARRAHGLAYAYLLRALGDGDEHDVHHADDPNHQRDERNGREHEPRRARELVVEVEQGVLRGDAEVVLLARGNLPAAAQEVCYLVHRRVDVLARVGAYDDEEDDEGRLDVAPVLVEARQRDEDRVVARLAEEVPQRLHHADDAEGRAVNLYLLPQRLLVREERAHNVLRQHGDVLPARDVRVGDEAPALYELRERVLVLGRDAEENRRVGLLVRVAKRRGNLAPYGRDGFDRLRDLASYRLGVFEGYVLAVKLLVVRRTPEARVEPRDEDGVGTQALYLVCESLVQSLNDGDHEGERDDANRHAEYGQRRAKLVRPHRRQSHRRRLFDVVERHAHLEGAPVARRPQPSQPSFRSTKPPRTLLRAERLDGVEARSLPSGPESARDADERGDADAQDSRPRAEEEREAHRLREQEGEREARAHAEQAADGSYHDGLDQELQEHVAARSAHGLSYAYLARPLRDRDEHDVHHDDASDDERDGGDAQRHELYVRGRALVEVYEHVLRLKREAVVLVAVGLAAPVAHDGAHLVLGGGELRVLRNLHERDERGARGESLSEGRVRNLHEVVAREAEDFSETLGDADDFVTPPLDAHAAAYDPFVGRAVEEVVHQVRAYDGNVSPGCLLHVSPRAARDNVRVLDGEHGDGQAADAHVVHGLVAGLDRGLRVGGDARAPAERAEARD